MKLHFEPDLNYQLQAIEAVCELFRGQETCRTEFTVVHRRPPPDGSNANDVGPQFDLGIRDTSLGIGNRLALLDEEIHANLKDIQVRNGVRPDDALASNHFSVEMETGTGKTYVYLRTAFELNRRFGFTKFVVVVPSVAIKEGVYKSLQMTEEHFRGLYAGVPCGYFIYDSAKLGEVRNFATSSTIQIMVMTVQALVRKDYAVVYQERDQIGGEKPIDLIKATSPIVIIDEPQSVEGGDEGKGAQAIREMNPLCTLRYSATHRNPHHMVYRLDAVDAYQRKLVKQIEVAAASVESAFNKPYVRLVSVSSSRRDGVTARIELDVATATGATRREVTVRDGDDLRETSGNRDVYENHRIGDMRAGRGYESLELRFPGGEQFLRPGESHGDVDGLSVQREMIRRTIKEHLDKEKRLRPQGIKVLSLFFIDEVAKYRQFDAEGSATKGEYARLFEEEYARLAKHPDYNTLFGEVDVTAAAADAHAGYFAVDRKKIAGKSVEVLKDTKGNSAADDDAYNLIMKDKERLLGFETPLKFIFSHSALREGWDNPNVFQICTLRDIRTERERRQTIGRGLRLCVNQAGERQRGFAINTLTVVATESYEDFADKLQKEIEDETGIRFGIVEDHQFGAIPVADAGGVTIPLGYEQSKLIWEHLWSEGYIDSAGRVQDSLRAALKTGSVKLPASVKEQHVRIEEILRKLAGKLEIRNADERRTVKPREAVLHSAEFKALWDRVKHKTTYRVHFDNERLLRECTEALHEAPEIAKTRLQWRKAELEIGKGGVTALEIEGAATIVLSEQDIELPDILTDLQDRTQLTRRSIYRILAESGRLNDFKRNPQQFIQVAATTINHRKRLALVDGIKYQRLGEAEYYAQELFEQNELTGYLRSMLADTKKSVYEDVVYESAVESKFADDLEKNSAVKVYAKLPGWFTVPTPLGSYNPDWAVLVDTPEGERLYLVVETKHTAYEHELFETERGKIACGRRHYAALTAHAKSVGEPSVEYTVAPSVESMLASRI